ncbi:hypothetical protein IGI37_000108 [Enterococcus sp. AZ194]|uniref:phage tail protein n=1 Tax=Enterococcus sp. AZ194 TaxID=2774629 RepID=UPI003F2687F8
MGDLIIRNFEETKEEILVDVDKDSFTVNWQKNETWEVNFKVMRTDGNSVVFDLVDYESIVIWEGQQYVIKQLKSYAVGKQQFKEVVAIHIYYTIKDGRQYSEKTGTLSITQCLQHIFASGTRGFSYEIIDPNNRFLKVEQENFGKDNYLKLIEEVLDDYDAVVIPNNKRLTFYPSADYGQKTNEQIRYRYNTDNVNFDIDTFDLKTQIRGFGKQKDESAGGGYYFNPITYTSTQATVWGVRIQDPVEDDRYTNSGNMLARLKRELQDYPNVSGSTTLKWSVDLNKGDYVTFVYEPLNINMWIQVVGITDYPMIPNKPPEIVFSNTKKTMTSIIKQLLKKG